MKLENLIITVAVTALIGCGSENNVVNQDTSESGSDISGTSGTDTGEIPDMVGGDTDLEDTETSGDGDGDPGDGDGEPVETTSLEVESDGVRIGYLQGVGEYTLGIWDESQNLLFSINDTTGFVGGSGYYYFTSNNCSGTRYTSAPVPTQVCNSSPAPSKRRIWGQSLDWTGFVESNSLETTAGAPLLIVYKSADFGNGMCTILDSNISETCVFEITQTNEIPTSFPLPIEIVESVP